MSENDEHKDQIDTQGGAFFEGPVSADRDVIGRDMVVHGDEVYGDKIVIGKISIAVPHTPILDAPLRLNFTRLIEEHTEHFGGRQDVLDIIGNFIQNSIGGYLLITAPAGFGKTALMAKLVSGSPGAFAYHFFTNRYSASGLDERFFLSNVVEQMANWHGEEGQAPDDRYRLRALYQRYLAEPMDGSRTLVLDGIDEVSDWNVTDYLGHRLQDGMHVILTVRESGRSWTELVNDYSIGEPVEPLILGGLLPEDVGDVLRAAGDQAAALASDAELLDKVVNISLYPENETLGSDPLYVSLLARDAAEGKLTAETLDEQPPSLEEYLDNWWGDLKAAASDDAIKDLFGTLTAALGRMRPNELEGINSSLRDDWAADAVIDVLNKVRRFVLGDEKRGYELFHPRLHDYLLDHRKIHKERYEARILDWCRSFRGQNWPTQTPNYVLKHYIAHLKAAKEINMLYEVVLDPDFIEAQSKGLSQIQTTLSDLKLAAEIAVDNQDWLRVLETIGVYRQTIRSKDSTDAIFAAIVDNNFEEAQRQAAFFGVAPKPRGRWATILQLYLGWEGAIRGDIAAVEKAVAAAGDLSRTFTKDLGEALLTRTARTLVRTIDNGKDAVDWLAQLAPYNNKAELENLLQRYMITQPIGESGKRKQKLAELKESMRDFWMPYMNDAAGPPVYPDEESAMILGRIRDLMISVAAEKDGQEAIDEGLEYILPSAYPRYRDIGLVEIGVACLAVSVESWVQQRLQKILEVGLNAEGVIFAFNLPAVLLSEVRSNLRKLMANIPAKNKLDAYISKALESEDRWGTAMRAQTATAASFYWQGEINTAWEELQGASKRQTGFAGYGSMAMMLIANRCQEFGEPERAFIPEWGPSQNASLFDLTEYLAEQVNSDEFRSERRKLVQKLKQEWWLEDTSDVDSVLRRLAEIPAPDFRRAYKDLAASRWANQGDDVSQEALAKLVLATLSDGTTLDAVLARLLATYLREMGDDELVGCFDLCTQYFIVEKPWEIDVQTYLVRIG